MKKVRVRYAPSPTGHLHIGNARTALFNYLFAKHYQGDFIVRIEDTDLERNIEGGEQSQFFYLNWLGIEADESPLQPNPKYAPYRQMERLDIYNKYVEILLEKGFAYRCFCSEEELEADYEKQRATGNVFTKYNQKCRDLIPEEIASNLKNGLPYTIRIKVPDNKTYTFKDLIRGEVSFESKDIGDWVILKSNGIPTYNFAVVIDDLEMDITHVFRGEEHISNTPKQLMIYEMLEKEAPIFGHMTLIVNENHKKLSKRDHSIMQYMSQYKEKGYLAPAMFNFMSLLGWSPEGEEEIFSKEDLIKLFDETRLSKSPSMFDKNKLTWMNNRYIKALSDSEYLELVRPFMQEAHPEINDLDWLDALMLLYKEQLSYGAEITDLTKLFFIENNNLEPEALEVYQAETTLKVATAFLNNLHNFQWDTENLKEIMSLTKSESEVKGKPLFMGLRVVLTSSMHGPDLINTIYLLGKDTVIKNLQRRINYEH